MSAFALSKNTSAECTESVEAHNRPFFDKLKHRPSPIRAGVTIGQSLAGRPSRQHRTTHRSTKSQVFQRMLPASSSSSPQHRGAANVRLSFRPRTRYQPCHITTGGRRDPNRRGTNRYWSATAIDRLCPGTGMDHDQMIAFRLGGAGESTVSPSTTTRPRQSVDTDPPSIPDVVRIVHVQIA